MKIKQQAGLTTLGLMLVIAIFGFLVITGFKVIPLYMDYYQVQTIVKAVNQDNTVNVKSRKDIWAAINKRLRINNIRQLKQENFIVTRENKKTTVTIDYDVQNTYIANLYLGAKFNKSIEFDR
ncbi:MAG: DUF4845 domain-containing protein [Gammaproteobacteria bacterium]|nr:DUF4845 domain-containing protein [Gammaproteobacteria bacterium]